MNTFAVDSLAAKDRRLERRLSNPTSQPGDLLPLIRSQLVGLGYAKVDPRSSALDAVEETTWLDHGFSKCGPLWRAEPWLPEWLDHHGTPPDAAAASGIRRQRDWSLTADSFYTRAMGHQTAKNPGQVAAIRAANILGPGETLICVLPTGSGKTDVVLTRARLREPRQSVIIVPTVSLALDLERRVTKPGDRAVAYHGGLSESEKHRIRSEFGHGDQALLITSPEAACTSLSGPLKASAKSGRLDLIAIDEAHTVTGWGDDFRPAFHMFAGLRRELLEIAPEGSKPSTILLTGTLDTYGFESLQRLFGGSQNQLLSAQVTRPKST